MKSSSLEILTQAPVVPVIVINDIAQAVPLAKALVAGGIRVLEVTLRTAQGLEAIRRIRDEVPDAIVGAGTVCSAKDVELAAAAGSEFLFTPGFTDELLRAGSECGLPFVPGASTVGDVMRCMERGINTLKFFPAEACGGTAVLKAIAGPFPQLRFCPTGGIGPHNIGDYLALASVVSVGGSWLTPSHLLANHDWDAITQLATEAAELVHQLRGQAQGEMR
ncbi:bifunctional 4-hydroxy-2-oxoglutarate aldolase/2-dehydro-3-deoxy-phosphogluconate aldolase [Spongiibacter sp.]|uniref:bifunctional 4-hydroxy-2-oxoglutarate aldolase/2-dehydro-3-deoxy-phosphogluconate aldolase n=1 Tax=Spongiibacter sp. TaxID=2024860 RepID=UPI003569B0EE